MNVQDKNLGNTTFEQNVKNNETYKTLLSSIKLLKLQMHFIVYYCKWFPLIHFKRN